MAFNPFTIIKSLLIKEEGTLTPKQIEIIPGGDPDTKTRLFSSQTANVDLTLPNATDELLGRTASQEVVNKTIDADLNTITNIDNNEIKANAGIDATKIANGSVSNTEFQALDGVTSNIQTQLDGKQAAGNYITALTGDVVATGPGSVSATIQPASVTDSKVATGISAAKIGAGTVDNTEFGYLDGVTSSIQPQLDGKASTTLNNLGTTSLNADLLPSAAGARNLGSASLPFGTTNTQNLSRPDSGNLTISTTSGTILLNPSSNVDVSNKVISNLADPSSAQDAATKQYVDSVAAGLDPKQAVRVATTTSIGGSYATTPSNGRFTGAATTVDGVTLNSGDRVLVKDQVDQKQNGIYVYNGSGQYTRSADMDGSPASEVSAGNYTFATQGTVNSSSGFVLTGDGIFTLNTDNLVFTQFSGSGGASRFLDNLLSPTAINQDLLPGTNNTRALGSSSLKFTSAFIQGTVVTNTGVQSEGSNGLSIQTNSGGGNLTLQSGASSTTSSGNTTVSTGNATGVTGASGNVNVISGNSTNSNSGNVVIDTGTGNIAAAQGKVQLSGRYVEVIKPLNIQQGQTAIPVASQQSLTIPSSGNTEGMPILTASDSTTRRIVTVGAEGLPQAPNLIIGGDAEGKLTSSTSILTPYADAAGSAPVDGTGGSPTVTSAVISSGVLAGSKSYSLVKGAANVQGQGWSIDFSVPVAHRARVLSIKFDYLIASGTFAAGTSTADSDVTVWIYDVTNAQVIQPSSYKLLSNSTTLADNFQAEFQTSSNGSSYRLIFHVGSTSASAYTLTVDNVVVSPSDYVFGTPISDWQSYTPATTQGFGTTTNNEFFYRRVGSDVEIRAKFTSGTVAASEARIGLPPGLTSASTTLIPTIQVCGKGNQNSSGTTNFSGYVPLIEPSVTYVTFGAETSTLNGTTKYNGNQIATTGNVVSFFAKVPIAGWSSSVQMADQTSTRVVSFVGTQSSQAVTANVTNLTLTTVKDSHASWATNIYTVPVAGDYLVNGGFGVSAAASAQVYVNGVANGLMSSSTSAGTSAGSILVPNLKTGDTLAIRFTASVTVTSGNLGISRISGPSQIASSETVAASYYVSANFAASTTVPINYDTKDFDTHNAVTPSATAWKFTAPISGLYLVSGPAQMNNGTYIVLYKNGSVFKQAGGNAVANSVAVYSVIVSLNAGDFIDLRPGAAATIVGGAMSANGVGNINIQRIGNRG